MTKKIVTTQPRKSGIQTDFGLSVGIFLCCFFVLLSGGYVQNHVFNFFLRLLVLVTGRILRHQTSVASDCPII